MAAERSRRLQSTCPSSVARPTPDRISYRAPEKGLAYKKRAPGWGGREARPPPEVGAAGPRLGRPGLGTSCTSSTTATSTPPPPRELLMPSTNRFLALVFLMFLQVMTVLHKTIASMFNDRFPCDGFKDHLSLLFSFSK